MDTLAHGHAVFEFASMFNAYIGFYVSNQTSRHFLGIDYETGVEIWNKSLRMYFEGADETAIRAIEEKAMILGYSRLLRRRIRRLRLHGTGIHPGSLRDAGGMPGDHLLSGRPCGASAQSGQPDLLIQRYNAEAMSLKSYEAKFFSATLEIFPQSGYSCIQLSIRINRTKKL